MNEITEDQGGGSIALRTVASYFKKNRYTDSAYGLCTDTPRSKNRDVP